MLGTAGVLLNMYADDNNEYQCTGKLGEHSKCCHGNSAFARSQNDIVPEFFQIGETLFLTNDGWSGLVKVKYFFLYKANIVEIFVTNSNGENIVTTKEHLRPPYNPDIGWIPYSAPEYIKSDKLLSEEEIENITSTTHLSPLQQYFFIVHYKTNHLIFTIMLQLAKMSILTCCFLKLKNDWPHGVSCFFVETNFWPWSQKSSAKSYVGVLCSLDINKHVKRVGTDQILSDQPEIVPWEK